MQQIRYFNSAWNDIKHSNGWFGKMCLLGLISIIPIFGSIVTQGYLYGWAREIAWGVHEPMPSKIFGNEDGKLYRRGFYLFVFNLVLALIVWAVLYAVAIIPGMASVNTASPYSQLGVSVVSYSVIYYIIYIAVIIVETFVAWIGSMRISIYDRLSAGFQFGKAWKMYQHESNGLWRIFGMQLIVGFVLGFILSLIFTILLAGVLMGAIGSMGYMISDYSSTEMLMHLLGSAGPGFIIVVVAMLYVFIVAAVFLEALVARALGYWAMQFDVPRWRSQDDPMPFEQSYAG